MTKKSTVAKTKGKTPRTPVAKKEPYSPSRLEYFVAAALTGIMSNPSTFKTAQGGTSVTDNALIMAIAMIEKIDSEKTSPRFYSNVLRR